MAKQQALRQQIRKGVIFCTFLFFPVILNYFSPYVIMDGASQGIINGSFIVFGLRFFVLARAWPSVVWVGVPSGRSAGGGIRDQ